MRTRYGKVTMNDEQSGKQTVVVGLVADPGLPDKAVRAVVGEVCEQLTQKLGSSVAWDLQVRTDTLTLNDEGTLDLLGDAPAILKDAGWDMMVCVTELPRRVHNKPVSFDLSAARGVALISLPGLGWFRVRSHTRDTLVHMIGRMAAERIGVDPDLARPKYKGMAGWMQRFSPLREHPGDGHDIEAFLALEGVTGKTRLLLGMTRTNRPWRLLPSLSSAIAAAAGFASFGIFYSSIWNMADAASVPRLTAVTVLSITAMVGWLIWHNGLWVPAAGEDKREGAMLYNTATILTLSIGVACMYVVLFVLAVIAALIIIPTGHLETTLRHPVGIFDYVALVWLATSLGTVAGALGSSFESEEAVRRATYSMRENERRRRDALRHEAEEDVRGSDPEVDDEKEQREAAEAAAERQKEKQREEREQEEKEQQRQEEQREERQRQEQRQD